MTGVQTCALPIQNPDDGGDSGENESGGGNENAGGNGEENPDADSTGGSREQDGDAQDEARAAQITRETVGFSIKTGSFVMPAYGSEHTQDDLIAGTLTTDGQDTDTMPAEEKDASEDVRTESETNTEEVTIEISHGSPPLLTTAIRRASISLRPSCRKNTSWRRMSACRKSE